MCVFMSELNCMSVLSQLLVPVISNRGFGSTKLMMRRAT
jgi:hypothetical protein